MHLRPRQVWQRMGATVMIGQNNVQGQNFTADALAGIMLAATGKSDADRTAPGPRLLAWLGHGLASLSGATAPPG